MNVSTIAYNINLILFDYRLRQNNHLICERTSDHSFHRINRIQITEASKCESKILISLNVQNLFTNIPTTEVLQLIEDMNSL